MSDGALISIGIIGIVWYILAVAGWWKMFEKAGEAGWRAIIPIWNTIVMLRIVGQPLWMLIGFFIPFVNFIVWIVVMAQIAKSFGKGIGYVLGLIFLSPLFAIILGFGDATYQGPAAKSQV